MSASSLLISRWCDNVTVTPLLNKIIVFKSGIVKGLKELQPTGGHIFPNSRLGLSA